VILTPPSNLRLEPGWYAMVLSGADHRARMEAWLKVPAGRPPSDAHRPRGRGPGGSPV
jgi:hypothetical protein